MREKFPHLSQRLYFRPEVRIVIEDGRSFIRRSPEKYQVIQATLVDTWASTAAGAFALSENNLYTVEAFEDYLRHLTDDGVLAFTRWGFEPPRESLRLVSLAIAALGQARREGRRGAHVIVARENVRIAGPGAHGHGAHFAQAILRRTMSTSRAPAWPRPECEPSICRATATTTRSRELLHAPDPRRVPEQATATTSPPVDDNRPFFFYTVQPRDFCAS